MSNEAMTGEQDRLLPCPSCKRMPRVYRNDVKECETLGCMLYEHQFSDERWSARPASSPDPAAIAAIRERRANMYRGLNYRSDWIAMGRMKSDLDTLLAVIDSRPIAAHTEGLAIAESLLSTMEYDGDIHNVSQGHCKECMCFPDKPTTAKVWHERGRVGHKPDCKRGARFAKALAAVRTDSQPNVEFLEAEVKRLQDERNLYANMVGKGAQPVEPKE